MRPFHLLIVGVVAALAGCTAQRDAAVWTFRTDRPWLAGDSQARTPLVSRESVFFCGGYVWNDDAAIHALSARDGRLLWTHRVGDCASDPWLLAGTLITYSRESHSGPCVFQGFDPATGDVRWRREFRKDAPATISTCTIHDVIVGESLLFAFAGDQEVHAVHAADGASERFAITIERRPGQRVWLAASAADAWFGVGTHVWRWPADRSQPADAIELSRAADSAERAALVGTELILGGEDPAWLRAFDLTTGGLRWERTSLPRILSLSADAERLYANVWRRRFELIALDLNTGTERWSAGAGGFLPPTRKDHWLYANGGSSVLVIDPNTGRIARTIQTDAEVITTPIRDGHLVLFGTIDGSLHAVRIDN